jgi:hypothetical protein
MNWKRFGRKPEGTEENQEILVRRVDVLTEIQTKYLQSMSLECYQRAVMIGDPVGSFNEM